MVYLKCIQDCFMDGGTQCFTNGGRYQIISGSPQDISGAELRDDQGSSHLVSGEWVDRFLIMMPSMEMDEFFESIDGLKGRRERVKIQRAEREAAKLWEEDEPEKGWVLDDTWAVNSTAVHQIWERDSDYPTPLSDTDQ